jgi:hypothetical protein
LVFGVFQALAAQPAAVQENRYLLIVDISKSMQDRAPGSLKAVEELLLSGMDGQIQDGDTIALWTFNDELYTGRFPISRWSTAQQGAIAGRVLEFLQGQKYGKTAKLDKLMPPMGYVVQDSQLLTLILVTDGEQKIQGTPFDDPINEFCARLNKKQQKARMPFVIVLRAVKGQITDYAVSTPPRSVRVPLVPAPVQLARTSPANTPAVADQALKKPAGALVFSGSDPKPVPAAKLVEAAVTKPPPAEKSESPAPASPRKTVKAEVVPPPSVTSEEVRTTIAEIVPAIVELPDELFAPRTVDKALQAESSKAEHVRTEPPKTTQSLPAAVKNEIVATPPPSAAVSTPPATGTVAHIEAPMPKTEAQKEPEPKAAVPVPIKLAAAPAPAPPVPAETTIPKPAIRTEPKTNSVPTPNPTTAASPAAAVTGSVAHAAEVRTLKPASVDSPAIATQPAIHFPAAQSPQIALANPSQPLSTNWVVWMAALVAALMGIACSLLLVRRSRTAPTASLITCSLERNKRG